jgi:hypothetical protein
VLEFLLPAAPRTKTDSVAPRTLIAFNGDLSHLLDFIYDSPRAWNYTVNHGALIR